jgi:hypothetical protein
VPDQQPWQLENFLERLDDWIAREGPAHDLVLVVTAWLLSRMEDPYQGARREAGFDNLWFGVIPNSGDHAGHVVGCSYWIFESRRAVRCDNFGLLNWPA